MEPIGPSRNLPRNFQIGVKGRGVASFRWESEGGVRQGVPGFNPWVGKIPWSGAWQPTPVFLPGESPWTEEPGGLQSMGLQIET